MITASLFLPQLAMVAAGPLGPASGVVLQFAWVDWTYDLYQRWLKLRLF